MNKQDEVITAYKELLLDRNCPFCGEDASRVLVELLPHQFCEVNFAYRKDATSFLGIPSTIAFPIVQCKKCSFVFSKYLLCGKLLNKVYEEIIIPEKCYEYSTSLPVYQNNLNIWYKLFYILLKNLDKRKTIRVLDYGSGWGTFLEIAKGPGIQVFGFETSSCRLKHMSQSGIKVVKSFEEARLYGGYDIICCNQVLEHVDSPRSILRELHMLLKANGVAYFSVPNYCLSNLNKQIQKNQFGKPIPKELNPWEHLNYFTPNSFYSMITKGGFKPINFFPIEPVCSNEFSHIRFLKDIIWKELELLKSALSYSVKQKTQVRNTEIYARA